MSEVLIYANLHSLTAQTEHVQAMISSASERVPEPWVQLEPGDHDLSRFLAGMMTMLQTIRPGLRVIALALLDAREPADDLTASPHPNSETLALHTAQQRAASAADLVEPLSDRELDILRLIAAGHSNREIAQKRVVALSTIKWHVNNIYAKLGAHSRTLAVARATELRLL
jgi:ATP/maltotriose-dependent transcriptional regulator MalT